MANDKIYPIDMNSKDILLQNEGGGGMIMNDQFIGIVGNMLPDQKQLLDDQEHSGGTNIQTDKFSSNIIITNASSNPVGVNDLASKNFDSLDQSIGTNQVVAPAPKDHCGGEGLLNYEWQEISKNIDSWSKLHDTTKVKGRPKIPKMYKPKNGVLESKYYNDYIKSEDQLKAFLYDQPMIDIIKSIYTLDNSGFPNFLNVSEDNWTISEEIKDNYSKRWIHIENTSAESLGMVKNKLKYFKNNNGINKFESRSVFDIQVLPSGLRSFVYGTLYRGIDQYVWHELLLVTIGPDYLNILTGLGLTKVQAFNDDIFDDNSKNWKKASTASETQEKFFKEYEDIINAYNEDKTKFLNTLYKVSQEFFESYIKFNLAPPAIYSQWYTDNIYLPYFKVQRNMSLAIALKYADCPDEYELAGNIPPTPTPSVSVAATTTPTVAETNDDIYAAEFLPASEDEEFLVFDNFDYKDTCSDIAKNTPPPNNKLNNITAALPKEITKADLDAYVKFSDQAERDYNNGIINPNTIKDLVAIGKAANIKIYVGTSRAGHSCETTSGNLSRHMKGYGLDLPGFYDLSGTINGGKYTSSPNANSAGTVNANFKALADRFVAAASTLPNSARSEGGNQRGILWYFNQKKLGGNHFNHVHYSNNQNYSGWSPATIPASFGCDCAKVRKNGLKALNCP